VAHQRTELRCPGEGLDGVEDVVLAPIGGSYRASVDDDVTGRHPWPPSLRAHLLEFDSSLEQVKSRIAHRLAGLGARTGHTRQ
jgi:hypothetical protein